MVITSGPTEWKKDFFPFVDMFSKSLQLMYYFDYLKKHSIENGLINYTH
jgi:hypothetical protein